MANVKNLSFEQLVAAEKAANVVRKNYEDKVAMCRGIDYMEQNEKLQNEYTEYINFIRLKILDEMENKLLNLDTGE